MRFLPSLCLAWLGLLAGVASGHPIPDIPVRAYFEAGGKCTIKVEVDPRCFKEDPNAASSLKYEFVPNMPEADQAAYFEKAKAFIPQTVEFLFEPMGRLTPDFEWAWTTEGGGALSKPEDVTVLTGTWHTTMPSGMQGYRIRALPQGKLAVVFVNHINGQAVERMAVLFPGETSYLLDLTGLNAAAPSGPSAGAVGANAGAAGWLGTFVDLFRQGFLHVLPKGLDHILFVLGLFLLSREWKPLLWQISTFTVAHTITLALATLGWVNVPVSIVEPIIAASIVFIALENIFRAKYSLWRLLVVFIFGLVHGLGFASALQGLDQPASSRVVGLLGFNVGVEAGQIAVVTIAFLLTAWLRDPVLYRRYVVIPGSAVIALMGAWWTVERVFG